MINNKTIRLSTVNALKANANLTALVANTRIYNSKVTPHLFGTLPCVGVYLTNSAADGANHVTPGFNRTLDIVIEAAVSGNSATYMDTCDDILFAVKQSLFGNTVWHGQFEAIAGYREEIQLDDGGESPVALAVLTISTEVVEMS
jgi:hypothetical protein